MNIEFRSIKLFVHFKAEIFNHIVANSWQHTPLNWLFNHFSFPLMKYFPWSLMKISSHSYTMIVFIQCVQKDNVMKYLNGKIPIVRWQKYTKFSETLCLHSYPYELWNLRWRFYSSKLKYIYPNATIQYIYYVITVYLSI